LDSSIGWARTSPERPQGVERVIQHDLIDRMALMLLDGQIKEGTTVKVDTSKGGELVIK
jgi:ATP-dependent Clp protease ATP-binding subunit ClpA